MRMRAQVGGSSVHAHRVVLAARCSYFRGMFESGMREALQSESTLSDISHPVFMAVTDRAPPHSHGAHRSPSAVFPAHGAPLQAAGHRACVRAWAAQVLEHLYTDAVEISSEIALELFAAADFLGVEQVCAWHARTCTPCMHTHVHPADQCMCSSRRPTSSGSSSSS